MVSGSSRKYKKTEKRLAAKAAFSCQGTRYEAFTSFRWDALGVNDDDLRRLEFDIMMKHDKYPVIQGTGGLRKARFAFEHRGKSGSVRVCYQKAD